MAEAQLSALFQPLAFPSGKVLKNRIVKSAMSDSLGDGKGNPTAAQIRLYQRWAEGGAAAAIVGEVQGNPKFAEKPGNLVLRSGADRNAFRALAEAGSVNGAMIWLQLGHAGALTHPPIGTPKGPSRLDLPGLCCEALSAGEIQNLPGAFAETAKLAKDLGFDGVEIHAAHGFLLSQFLSPLFNKRQDAYGGSLAGRMRLLLETIDAVRSAVGPDFPVAVKLNASDQLEGGFQEAEALDVVSALDQTGLDLIDVSGGTYFPGARSMSDSAGGQPYFLDFAKRARCRTRKHLMVTGGFKTRHQAEAAVSEGHIDLVGLARAFVLAPDLPERWSADRPEDPVFPTFVRPPPGGVTAWYTMRLTEIGEDRETDAVADLEDAIASYEARDDARVASWTERFGAS